MPLLNFDAPFEDSPGTAAPSNKLREPERSGTAALFGDEPELPPTWSEGSEVYHTTEKCSRLQAIRKNRRMQSASPPSWMRLCFNCEDIIRTKRLG